MKIEVARSAVLAYIYDTYLLTVGAPSETGAVNDRGKFLEVWKKQIDGQWKCIVNTYNSDLPAPAPAR